MDAIGAQYSTTTVSTQSCVICSGRLYSSVIDRSTCEMCWFESRLRCRSTSLERHTSSSYGATSTGILSSAIESWMELSVDVMLSMLEPGTRRNDVETMRSFSIVIDAGCALVSGLALDAT